MADPSITRRARTRPRAGPSALALACLGAAGLLPLAAGPAAANSIQDENQHIGTSAWVLARPVTDSRCPDQPCSDAVSGAPEIEGYASLTSVNLGGSIYLFVHTIEPSYTIRVFRLGWYGGAGGREMTTPVTRTGVRQTIPAPDSTGMVQCAWINPYSLAIPSTWVSGQYIALLTAATSGRQAQIPFVVKDTTRRADFLFQSSVLTAHAYNCWGGKCLYANRSTGCVASVKVSLDRPYYQSSGGGQVLNWEINMIRWLEREGYDVNYCTDVDTHAQGGILLNHRAFLSVGHDEYWSWEMRKNVEAARDHGVSLGFFGANTCYWQVRLEPNRSGAPNRVMVCYKTLAKRQDPLALDGIPTNDQRLTLRWRDPPVSNPENTLVGQMYDSRFVDSGLHANDIVIDDPTSWVCRGTGLASGDRLVGLLGSEADRIFESAPRSLVRIAHSPFVVDSSGIEVFRGYSDMTVYTAPSGATVFSTGSIRWTWGLDEYAGTLQQTTAASGAAQQITRNVLERFIEGAPHTRGWIETDDGARMRIYPNPGPASTLELELPRANRVDVAVHDIAGREVDVLWSGRLDPGSHVFRWSGRDAHGSRARPGVYFYRLLVGNRLYAMRSVKLD